MTSAYDFGLVTISVLIAILASYAGLSFAGRVTSASGRARLGWLVGGAVVMGLGIWSMHFVGMLAFQLPVPIGYGMTLILVSIAAAVAATLLALTVASGAELRPLRLVSAGVLMGAAISGMHYIGMAAMSAAVSVTYGAALVALSILIAIVASIAALRLTFRFRSDTSSRVWLRKAVSAIALGVAISGMHYMGMAAARFAPGSMMTTSGSRVLATRELGEAIALGALVIIVLGIVGSAIERRWLAERAALTDRLAAQAEQLLEQREALMVQAQQRDRALREAERAREAEHEANAARVKFVNMASHELRTPIGAIGGYADLLLNELRGPINDAQRKDLRRILANQTHLLRLINEMLDLAKLESGQMPVHLDEMQLSDVLDQVSPMVEPQLIAKHIAYERELAPGTPRVIGDAERVQQIVINLLANSIRFTPPSGKITVSTRSYGSEVELRVTDTGPGIPADKVGSLFSPFVQLGSAKEKAGGTGLGLAISRELARAMGGEMRVIGGEGNGATFILALRAATECTIK